MEFPVVEFRPGQVWRYRTRPNEEDSRLVVCRVEQSTDGRPIVHVRIEGVAITAPGSEEVTREIEMLPFDAEALEDSVVELESTRDSVPDIGETWALWRETFGGSSRAVFAITVAEAIDHVESVIARENPNR